MAKGFPGNFPAGRPPVYRDGKLWYTDSKLGPCTLREKPPGARPRTIRNGADPWETD